MRNCGIILKSLVLFCVMACSIQTPLAYAVDKICDLHLTAERTSLETVWIAGESGSVLFNSGFRKYFFDQAFTPEMRPKMHPSIDLSLKGDVVAYLDPSSKKLIIKNTKDGETVRAIALTEFPQLKETDILTRVSQDGRLISIQEKNAARATIWSTSFRHPLLTIDAVSENEKYFGIGTWFSEKHLVVYKYGKIALYGLESGRPKLKEIFALRALEKNVLPGEGGVFFPVIRNMVMKASYHEQSDTIVVFYSGRQPSLLRRPGKNMLRSEIELDAPQVIKQMNEKLPQVEEYDLVGALSLAGYTGTGAVSPSGELVVAIRTQGSGLTANHRTFLDVFSAQSKKLLNTLELWNLPNSVAISPNDQLIAVALHPDSTNPSLATEVVVFEIANMKRPLFVIKKADLAEASHLAFDGNDAIVGASTNMGEIKRWNLR